MIESTILDKLHPPPSSIPSTVRWNDGLATYNGGDLPPYEQSYKELSEYPDLDRPFRDMSDLHQRAQDYDSFMSERKWRPRKRG